MHCIEDPDLWDLAASVPVTITPCQANVEQCFSLVQRPSRLGAVTHIARAGAKSRPMSLPATCSTPAQLDSARTKLFAGWATR